MGRRTETDVNIRMYTKDMMDRYLIGYLSYNNRLEKIVFGMDLIRDEAYLASAKQALEDQELINEHLGIENVELPCPKRIMVKEPIIFYGFTNPDVELTRSEETRIRNKVKSLSHIKTTREIDRDIYGDELFCIVSKFKVDGEYWVMAIGKAIASDGSTRVINQKIHKIEEGTNVDVLVLGEDGLCYPSSKKRRNCYYSWHLHKQTLGAPMIQICIRSSEGRFEKNFELITEGDIHFQEVALACRDEYI